MLLSTHLAPLSGNFITISGKPTKLGRLSSFSIHHHAVRYLCYSHLFQLPIFMQVSIYGEISVGRRHLANASRLHSKYMCSSVECRHLATENRINIAALIAPLRSSSLTVERSTTCTYIHTYIHTFNLLKETLKQ